MVQSAGAQRTLPYVCTDGSRRACAVGDCPRLVSTLGDPRETSGPRIDRFSSTRPPWCRRQYRDIQKLIFSAPSKCPIDLFGPVANRTCLPTARRPTASISEWFCDLHKHPSLESTAALLPSCHHGYPSPSTYCYRGGMRGPGRQAACPARTRRKAFCHRRSGGWRASTVSSNVEALRSHLYL